MARRLLVLLILSLPAQVLAINLELRQAGTSSSEISAVVGEEIDVEVWLDSGGRQVSGAAIFLSFDESVFELVALDRDPSPGFQPFEQGGFLGNGEVYRNDLLDPDDPAATFAGSQMDYSVVRAVDNGSGTVAKFRLRALVPVRNSAVRIDESGIRETRVFLPDGSQQSFRFIKPLTVRVQGISLVGLPDRLVLARGQVDSTSFRLDELIFDPLYGVEEIQWTISPLGSIQVQRVTRPNSLVLSAPTATSTWERLVIAAENPDGQTAADTVDIYVNASPKLTPPDGPLTLTEDGSLELELSPLVVDPDSEPEELSWHSSGTSHILATVLSTPARVRFEPAAHWSGSEQFVLTVSDEYGFSDSIQVEVVVQAVNDAPEFLMAPNLLVTVGRRDNSLLVSELISDLEDPLDLLQLEWSTATNFEVAIVDGRLVIAAGLEWVGTEEIQLLVRDSGGLTSTIPLTVTVARSIAPALINPPRRLGMAAGGQTILSLDDLVTDPDDDDTELLWSVAGQNELQVQLSNGRAVRLEAPAAFNGIELLTFTVADPSGETASFELLVFSAPANGEPILAPIPDVRVPLDGVDTSVDLDDYVYDLDHEPGLIDWFLPTHADLTLRVDPESHVLTVAPTADASAGVVDLQLTAIDPDGHEASLTLRIHLVGTGPVSSFTVAPIPDVAFAAGEGYDLELDSFISGDVDASQIQWSVEKAQNLQVELDPVSHGARIQALPGWTGTEELVFVAAGAATVKRRTVRITVRSSGETGPSLAQLPRLSLRAGTFDQSLDLDDFVVGIDPSGLSWAVTTETENLQILIDPQSHEVVVLPRADWDGEEQLVLEARDTQGIVLTGLLVVEVLRDPGLELQEVRAPLFAGESEFRLSASDVLAGVTDPEKLTWAATGSQPISVVYDARTGFLLLTGNEPWQASDIITLMARDQNHAESSSHVLLEVYPADGSMGATSPDFRLLVVPNPLQPDYLDLFVVSQIVLQRAPLLRLQANIFEGVNLVDRADGIWHGHHVLQPGQDGNVDFVALGLDEGLNLLKADLTMTVGTVHAGNAKSVVRSDVSVEFSTRSFAEDAVVAILPGEEKAAGNELLPLSHPVLIHASAPYRGDSGKIHMRSVEESRHPALYRWDGSRWLFIGAAATDTGIGAPLPSVGLYALMDDLTPPVLAEERIDGVELSFRITDDGSGAAEPAVFLNGAPMPRHQFRWDGQWLILDRNPAVAANGLLHISLEDRVGNRGAPIERTLGEPARALPSRFSLGQNFPNPFNPSTVIPLEVAGVSANIKLQVFNAGGQLLRQLLNGQLAPGIYEIAWDARDGSGRNVAAGIYFYRLQVDERFETRKMSLVR